MIALPQTKTGVSALILIGMAVVGIVLLAGCGSSSETPDQSSTALPDGTAAAATTPMPATIEGGAMRLTVVAGGECTGTDCFVDAGATFTLAVEVIEAPESYILLQTFIDYGVYDPAASEDDAGPNSCSDGIENWTGEDALADGADRRDPDCAVLELTYLPTTSAADEILWTDVEAATVVRVDTMGPGLIGHGGISGLIPPLTESNETGVLVQLQLSCPANAVTVPISLLVYDDPVAKTSGSAFVGPGGGTKIIPTVTSINLHCVVS